MSFERLKEIKKLDVPLTEIETEILYLVCDGCKKKVRDTDTQTGWSIHTHSHQGWGNDSIESIETFHSCSFRCFFSNLKKSYDDVSGHEGAKICIEMGDEFLKPVLEIS